MASSLSTITLTESAQIASYNRGPITSLLALPDSCMQTLTSAEQNLYFGHYHEPYDQSCVVLGTLDNSQIAPATMWGQYHCRSREHSVDELRSSKFQADHDLYAETVDSPAIYPQGWTIVATFLSSFLFTPHGAVRTAYNLPLGPDTSAALCYPCGYTSLSDDHVCASMIQQNQAIRFIKPMIAGQIYNAGTPIVTKAAEPTIVKGDGIPIWWQSTDAQKLSSAVAATPTRVENFTYDNLTKDVASGLSGEAKIGIGVGVSLSVIAGLLVGIYVGRRRRNRTDGDSTQQTAENDASKPDPVILGQELDNHSRFEMAQAAPELGESREHAYELGGGRL